MGSEKERRGRNETEGEREWQGGVTNLDLDPLLQVS
jgi:hypothetical protein